MSPPPVPFFQGRILGHACLLLVFKLRRSRVTPQTLSLTSLIPYLFFVPVPPIDSAETQPNAGSEKAAGSKDAKAKAKGKAAGKGKDKDNTAAKGKAAKGEGEQRHRDSRRRGALFPRQRIRDFPFLA